MEEVPKLVAWLHPLAPLFDLTWSKSRETSEKESIARLGACEAAVVKLKENRKILDYSWQF